MEIHWGISGGGQIDNDYLVGMGWNQRNQMTLRDCIWQVCDSGSFVSVSSVIFEMLSLGAWVSWSRSYD